MATLVHIADARLAARITRAGLTPGKTTRVVYFMPVLRDHFISHQWLRELKRGGVRTLVGVYFRLPSEETVWAGRYNEPHQQIALGLAVRRLMDLADPLGYEMFIERKITASEITSVRNLPQKIGWRYEPHAHGTKPCGCPVCQPRGSYGGRKIRDAYEPAAPRASYESAKTILVAAADSDAMVNALWSLRTRRRRADPAFLEAAIASGAASGDDDLIEQVAVTLAYFRHPNSRSMLVRLREHGTAAVREAAAESLAELYGT